jgi:hypothetical protein
MTAEECQEVGGGVSSFLGSTNKIFCPRPSTNWCSITHRPLFGVSLEKAGRGRGGGGGKLERERVLRALRQE